MTTVEAVDARIEWEYPDRTGSRCWLAVRRASPTLMAIEAFYRLSLRIPCTVTVKLSEYDAEFAFSYEFDDDGVRPTTRRNRAELPGPGWIVCAPGECPLDLQLGDMVEYMGYVTEIVLLDTAVPGTYGCQVFGWVPANMITAYRRDS